MEIGRFQGSVVCALPSLQKHNVTGQFSEWALRKIDQLNGVGRVSSGKDESAAEKNSNVVLTGPLSNYLVDACTEQKSKIYQTSRRCVKWVLPYQHTTHLEIRNFPKEILQDQSAIDLKAVFFVNNRMLNRLVIS
uniref:Uncharacterized protein n=1 Tax=Romanomermis culicivorax TaxID=13658 RepID=A0A915JYN6_ROMCU